jgi:hypothetical protein
MPYDTRYTVEILQDLAELPHDSDIVDGLRHAPRWIRKLLRFCYAPRDRAADASDRRDPDHHEGVRRVSIHGTRERRDRLLRHDRDGERQVGTPVRSRRSPHADRQTAGGDLEGHPRALQRCGA